MVFKVGNSLSEAARSLSPTARGAGHVSRYFACLVTASSGDLHSELACKPAQLWFGSLNERGKALLNIEGHELLAGLVINNR